MKDLQMADQCSVFSFQYSRKNHLSSVILNKHNVECVYEDLNGDRMIDWLGYGDSMHVTMQQSHTILWRGPKICLLFCYTLQRRVHAYRA